ncbi:putative transposable element [Trichonephila clavipes]|uniref:Putative transposable element n=1 Tax=Trichonephila clavipes TaxID=2585209 RepID=A0A8X6SYM5_TRICX|nr:putative transposable element [Trichonephila clavipes]
MITNFFIPELNNHDVQELSFQQDGATCHTARATIDLLKDTFGDRLISRFGPVNWPPKSCDLTLLDYFLWGYVKSLVYADKPQTLDHLEDNILRVIADIRPQMLEKVIENWTPRLDYIRASRDSHMPEIIFKNGQYRESRDRSIAAFYLTRKLCIKYEQLVDLYRDKVVNCPLITGPTVCRSRPHKGDVKDLFHILSLIGINGPTVPMLTFPSSRLIIRSYS